MWSHWTQCNCNAIWSFSKALHIALPILWPMQVGVPRGNSEGTLQLGEGGGERTRLPKFKFLPKFPIGLHVILRLQIKKFKT